MSRPGVLPAPGPKALSMASLGDAGAWLCPQHLRMKAVLLKANITQNSFRILIATAYRSSLHKARSPWGQAKEGLLFRVNSKWSSPFQLPLSSW